MATNKKSNKNEKNDISYIEVAVVDAIAFISAMINAEYRNMFARIVYATDDIIVARIAKKIGNVVNFVTIELKNSDGIIIEKDEEGHLPQVLVNMPKGKVEFKTVLTPSSRYNTYKVALETTWKVWSKMAAEGEVIAKGMI